MAFAPYASLAEFKAWVNISDGIDDTQATAALTTVTRWTDEHCQRNFWQDTAVARVLEANSWWCLTLGPFNDLVSVSQLRTDQDGDGTFETTWSASDYQLTPVNPPNGRPFTRIESVAGRTFPVYCWGIGRRARVEVTGTWGWAAVPDAVKQACLIQTNRVLLRRNSPEGILGGQADFGVIRVSNRLDPDVADLLAPYVHPSTAVMVA